MAKTRTSARGDFFDAATEAAVNVNEVAKPTTSVSSPTASPTASTAPLQADSSAGSEKDEATAPIRVFLTPVTRAALKMVSKEQGKTYADIITDLVADAYPEVVAKAQFAADNGLLI